MPSNRDFVTRGCLSRFSHVLQAVLAFLLAYNDGNLCSDWSFTGVGFTTLDQKALFIFQNNVALVKHP